MEIIFVWGGGGKDFFVYLGELQRVDDSIDLKVGLGSIFLQI